MMPARSSNHKFRTNDMLPLDIQYAIKKRGSSQATIARAVGVKQPSIYKTIYGKMTSHRLRVAIAEAAGIDVARIWPSTYIYGGGPRKRGRPRKNH